VVQVRSPQASQLRDLLLGPDRTISSTEAGLLEVVASAPRRSAIWLRNRIRLHA